MKYVVVVIFLLSVSVVHSDFNRTTGLIDIPMAGTLPHGVMRCGLFMSFSEDSPDREENFNFSIGLFDRAEVSIGVLSKEAVELNLLCRVLEEGDKWPAIALGLWDIAAEEYVSDPGFGSDAYADELGYGENRAREQFSGFVVLSKTVIPRARFHLGLGRGRFVGWGPRSQHFKIGDEPNSAVALFMGLDVGVTPGIQLMGELDGRDVNLGLRYTRKWLEVNLGMSKLEHLISDSSEHSPRFVIGTSVSFPLMKKAASRPPEEEVHLSGDLSGKVMDIDSWEPVEASVKLIGTDIVKYADRDDGTFVIEDITPGHRVVEIDAPGYKSGAFAISLKAGKTVTQNFFLHKEKAEEQKVEREVTLNELVYFEVGQVEFTLVSKVALEKVAKVLKENPGLRAEIRGYTDSAGSHEFNLVLSKNRAGVVKAYLIQLYGIDPDRLEFEGYGEADPIGDNSTREGRATNRRVEIRSIK